VGAIYKVNNPKKHRNKSFQKVLNKMQLPLGSMPKTSHIKINSNREAIVEECRGVAEYNENLIKINLNKMSVVFFGRNLLLKCLSPDSLIIEGFILSIEFET
jgi:sporulation protein YqfC